MIFKSFYRRKTSKLYLALITIVLTSLTILNLFINYLNNILETKKSNEYVYFEISNQSYDKSTSIILGELLNEKLNNVFSEYELNNKVIIKQNNKLSENECNLYLSQIYYDIYKIDENNVEIVFNASIYNLKILNIDKNNDYSYIEVSSSLFDKLWNKKTYFINKKNYKYDGINEIVINNQFYDNENRLNDLEKKINILKVIFYIILNILIIVGLLIIKNIRYDIKTDKYLLYVLGIKNKYIKLYEVLLILSLFIIPMLLNIITIILF